MQRGFWIYSRYRPPGLLCPSVALCLLPSLAIRPSAPENIVSLCHESRSQMSAACVRAEFRWAGWRQDLSLPLLLLLYRLHWQMLLRSLSPQSWCPVCGWRALSQGCYSVSGPGPPLPRLGAVSGWPEPKGRKQESFTSVRKVQCKFPSNITSYHGCGSDCTSLWALCGSPHKTRVCVTNKEHDFFQFLIFFLLHSSQRLSNVFKFLFRQNFYKARSVF